MRGDGDDEWVSDAVRAENVWECGRKYSAVQRRTAPYYLLAHMRVDLIGI